MSNQSSHSDPDYPRPDWLTAAPSLPVRSFSCAILATPALLAASVYWLHSTRALMGPQAPDGIMEVRLLASPKRFDQQVDSGDMKRLASPVEASGSTSFSSGTTPTPPLPPLASRSSDSPAAAPPAARAQSAAKRSAVAAFRRALLAHIARFRRYPGEARRKGFSGVVYVLFAMRRDGTLTDLSIERSSGLTILDSAAADAIRHAQPLPRIPSDLPDHLTVLAPVDFEMPDAARSPLR
jgi:protein TonB